MSDPQTILAETFRRHEHLTPDPDAVLAGIRAARPRARRRHAMLAAAAAAVLLAAVPLALRATTARRPAPAAAPTFANASLAPGWLPPELMAGPYGPPAVRSEVSVVRRAGTLEAPMVIATSDPPQPSFPRLAVAFAVGNSEAAAYFDASDPRHPLRQGETVAVNGHPGTYRWEVRPSSIAGVGTSLGTARVTWRLADGLWASVRYEVEEPGVRDLLGRYRADALMVARDAKVLASHTGVVRWGARSPLRLTYLPAGAPRSGWVLDCAATGTSLGDWRSVLRSPLDAARPLPPEAGDPWSGTQYSRAALRGLIRVEIHRSGAPLGWKTTGESVRVKGRLAWWAQDHAGILLAQSSDGLSIGVFADLPPAELVKVAEGLRVADRLDDYRNWTDKPVG